MYLEIITPQQKVFEGEVVSASFPGTLGYFQILNNHAPMVSSIATGKVIYKSKENENEIWVKGGVVEILNNRVTLLADKVLDEDEIEEEIHE